MNNDFDQLLQDMAQDQVDFQTYICTSCGKKYHGEHHECRSCAFFNDHADDTLWPHSY